MLGINNENCFDTIRKMREKNRKVGLILTSPPYNTGRNSNSERGRNNLNKATFSLGKDLQKALNLGYDSKYAFIDGVLKGGNKCLPLK